MNIDKNAKIRWITPKADIYNIKRINATKIYGKYVVYITEGKKTYKDSTILKPVNQPIIQIRDTVICKNNPFIADAKNPGMKYLWSTFETTPKIKIENSGKYWVTVSNKGCNVTDTFKVSFFNGAQPGFGNEVSFCLSDEAKPLSIKVQPGTKITWNTGSNLPNINAVKEGWYWVKTENKTCGVQFDSVYVKLKACDCEMIIPNTFTPNEDNRNDYFFPVLQCEYSYYSFTVYDKWGNLIFTTNNPNGKWDGRFKGNLCDEDIYIYKIESTEKGSERKNNRSGHVSLIR